MPASKSPSPEQVESANAMTALMRSRLRARNKSGIENVPYDFDEYERDIHEMLCRLFPQCVLEGVRLFTPSFLEERDYGLEVDNMLHIQHGGTDYIVLVEAKNQKLRIDGDQWYATYDGKDKDVREQVEGHINALHEYLDPVSPNISVKFAYYVASNSAPDQTTSATSEKRNHEIHLVGYDQLVPSILKRFDLDPRREQKGRAKRVERLLTPW